ncbi:hypothetical protein HYS28_03415 [Candidatus Uhrbacteria bacterium]|nr:hypothetical protein [Candidatus Uhrbacteria bacterium]
MFIIPLSVALAAEPPSLQPTYVSGGEVTNNAFNIWGQPQVTVGPDGRALLTQGRISARYLGAVTDNHVAMLDAEGKYNVRTTMSGAALAATQLTVMTINGQDVVVPNGTPGGRVVEVSFESLPDGTVRFRTGDAAIVAELSKDAAAALYNPLGGVPYGIGGGTGRALWQLGVMDATYQAPMPVVQQPVQQPSQPAPQAPPAKPAAPLSDDEQAVLDALAG